MSVEMRQGARRRIRAVYAVTVSVVVMLVASIALLFYSELEESQRAVVSELLPKLIAYAAVAFAACLLLFGSMLRHLARAYVDPVIRLANETRLISVAAAPYRIPPAGGPEVAHLTDVINELSERHIALRTDVQRVVELSRAEALDEKQRLETLMLQMPEGVIVCNLDGRILLYNAQAQRISERSGRPGSESPATASGAIGIGRSVFGVLGRQAVVRGLNVLQRRLDRDGGREPFVFVTVRGGSCFLRVRMSPVMSRDAERIEGYVLMLSDITTGVHADSRRDMFLQTLTIGLQQELGRIRDAATLLLAADPAGNDVSREAGTVRDAAGTLLDRIDQIAVQHATRLLEPGGSECILGHDLLDMLSETIGADFRLPCQVTIDEDTWLKMNSYTVVRGVVYLLGQLTRATTVTGVRLHLASSPDGPRLVVRWDGAPVTASMLDQWKECPLMFGSTGSGRVSLRALLEGRGDVWATGDAGEETAAVRFRLDAAPRETSWVSDATPEPRPVYYDFGLFDRTEVRTELDGRPLSELTYVVFDTETTGLEPSAGDEIISLGAVRVVRGRIRSEETFDQLVDPRRSIPLESLRIHRITPEMLRGRPLISEVLAQFHPFAEGAVLVAHNAAFDMRFVRLRESAAGVVFDHPVLDTMLLSAVAYPNDEPHNLDAIAARLGIPIVGRHTALGDALVTAEILIKLIPLLAAFGVRTLAEAREASRHTPYSAVRF